MWQHLLQSWNKQVKLRTLEQSPSSFMNWGQLTFEVIPHPIFNIYLIHVCFAFRTILSIQYNNFIIWLSFVFNGLRTKLRVTIGCWTIRYFSLLNCPGQYSFYSGAMSFGGKISELILMKFTENYLFWKILDNKMCWNTSASFVKLIIAWKYDKQWSAGGHKKQSEQVTRAFEHVKVCWHRGRYVDVHRTQSLRKIICDASSSIII